MRPDAGGVRHRAALNRRRRNRLRTQNAPMAADERKCMRVRRRPLARSALFASCPPLNQPKSCRKGASVGRQPPDLYRADRSSPPRSHCEKRSDEAISVRIMRAQLDGDCRVAALLAMTNERSQPQMLEHRAAIDSSFTACHSRAGAGSTLRGRAAENGRFSWTSCPASR
jgi:hypothetical protein